MVCEWIKDCHDCSSLVVEMTDAQVREAQCVENLPREDVHPLEEGNAFAAMLGVRDWGPRSLIVCAQGWRPGHGTGIGELSGRSASHQPRQPQPSQGRLGAERDCPELR